MRNMLFTLPLCVASSLSTAGQLDVLDAASVFGGIVIPTSTINVSTTTPQAVTSTVTAPSVPEITSQAVSNAIPSAGNFNNELINSKVKNSSSEAFLSTFAAIPSPKQIKSWLRGSSREETQEIEVLLNELLQFETVTYSEANLYLEILRIIEE